MDNLAQNNNKNTDKAFALCGVRQRYYCPDCKGTTFDVDYCDNPDCPNMPCCGKPRELCDCKETGSKKV